MPKFVVCESDGAIVAAGAVAALPDEGAFAGLSIIETDVAGAGPETHYVLDGVVVAYSDAERSARANRPSALHHWDMPNKQWFDPRTIEQLREDKWEEVKRARRAAIEAGFEHGGHTFQADPVSLQNITGATLAALIAQQAQQPFAVDWTAADNTVVSLDAAAAIALGMAAVAHVSAAYAHGVDLREAIAAAESSGELEGITW